MKKRVLTLLMALCMIVSLLPFGASAAEIVKSGECGKNGDNVTWTLDSDGVLTISGEGDMADYKKESSDSTYSTSPFHNYINLKTVIIEDGVTSIGDYAFESCMSLKNITIPDSVKRIGKYAFYSCMDLESVTIPEGLKTIMHYTFHFCSRLQSVTLPNSLELVGAYAFGECGKLQNVVYHGTQEEWDAIEFGAGSYYVTHAERQLEAHVYGDWTRTVEPNCTETGMDSRTCSICGRIETQELPALGHDYNAVVTAPTCEEQGYTTYTCARCDDSYVDENSYAAALGHDYGEWTVTTAPSCTERGEETRVCAHDETHRETRPVDALGHDWGAWETTKEPTCTQAGEETRACSHDASHMETRAVEALGHDYNAVVTAPTCEEQGYTTYTCSRCNDSYVDHYVDALGHAYSEWALTMPPTCTDPGEEMRMCAHDSTHIETRPVDALGHDWGEWEVTTPATEEADGVKTRACTRCDATETGVIPSIAHEHDYATVTVTPPTCTEQGYTTHTCRCGDSKVDNYVDALGHDWGGWKTTNAATENEPGEQERTCKRCGETETQTTPPLSHEHHYKEQVTPPTCTEQGYITNTCECGDSYVDRYFDALGHDWGRWETTKEAAEGVPGEQKRTCERCGETETQATPPLPHEHNYIQQVTPPTCTERGYTTYLCTGCGESHQQDLVLPLGHDWGDWEVTKEATILEKGEETRVCRNDPSHKETHEIPALGDRVSEGNRYTKCVNDPVKLYYDTNHAVSYYTVDGTDEAVTFEMTNRSGSISSGPWGTIERYSYEYSLSASKPGTYLVGVYSSDSDYVTWYLLTVRNHDWGEWTVTTPATATEKGVMTRTCKHDSEHTETRDIPATGQKDPKPSDTKPSDQKPADQKPVSNPFTDVTADKYFYDPVLWALNHDPQITDGTTETTFSPKDTCTRGQVVTFLWRSMGCEEPKSTNNPFSDVKESDYFYKAVLWAVEKGITDGTSNTTFSPKDPCTRAHVVTFLWRAENKPAAGSNNPFSDVASGQYYYDAVLWAVEKGITDGTTETTFSPKDPCTRGQIVTFLYRDMK